MKTTKTQLIINTMKRSKYNELCATNNIQYDQLYLVEDENLDAFNGRVVNVAAPQISSDAINKSYADSTYIKTGTINNYIDNTKLYSNKNDGINYSIGSKYINSGLSVFEKQENPSWNIIVNKPATLKPSDITLTYTGAEFGWKFSFNDTFRYGSNKTELADVTKVDDPDYNIIATRIWPQIDSYISKKEIYSCLSSINKDSTKDDLISSIIQLNLLLSSFNR